MHKLVVMMEGVCVAVPMASPLLTYADFQKGKSAYDNKDYSTALREFRKAAEQGDPRAQFGLGVIYHYGKGVIQDYIRAHMWFNISASNGSKDGRNAKVVLEKSMSTDAIVEAQNLAREWVQKHRK